MNASWNILDKNSSIQSVKKIYLKPYYNLIKITLLKNTYTASLVIYKIIKL